MAQRMPILTFVSGLEAALNRKDGYIMGSKGQNPKKWAKDSWWFSQYKNASQHEKALYWREHAQRVWDCNGMSEGLYEDFSGVDINTKARYNYAGWCSIKGAGMIPAAYRVPGAAVFWTDTTASNIHHVAYLWKPVDPKKPSGAWLLIEAKGVKYGVVSSNLLSRTPTHWGIMDKYFDYSAVLSSTGAAALAPTAYTLGSRTLRNGMEGDDVKLLQTYLIELGYSCGKYGADGEFGDSTEIAVREFQHKNGLAVDGIYGPKSDAVMDKLMSNLTQASKTGKQVQIVGGQCYIRAAADKTAEALGVARENSVWEYAGDTADNGWLSIVKDGKKCWVSGMYGRLVN